MNSLREQILDFACPSAGSSIANTKEISLDGLTVDRYQRGSFGS